MATLLLQHWLLWVLLPTLGPLGWVVWAQLWDQEWLLVQVLVCGQQALLVPLGQVGLLGSLVLVQVLLGQSLLLGQVELAPWQVLQEVWCSQVHQVWVLL
jgi:hypothetical protein